MEKEKLYMDINGVLKKFQNKIPVGVRKTINFIQLCSIF